VTAEDDVQWDLLLDPLWADEVQRVGDNIDHSSRQLVYNYQRHFRNEVALELAI
jgi:hypothetical protein